AASDNVTRSLAIYALDSVGNRTTAPLKLTFRVDTVPPALTVATALATVPLLYAAPVLSGTIHDGAGVQDIAVRILTPGGDLRTAGVAERNGRWNYTPSLLSEPGAYSLWVDATDLAGNTTTAGPFYINVTCIDAKMTAIILTMHLQLGTGNT